MAKIEYVEHRLRNWALWKAGRSLHAGAGAAQDGMPREPWADAPLPVCDPEAVETEQAVQALPEVLCRTIVVHYLGGGNERRRLELLDIGKTTLHERIDAAHRHLANWFTDLNQRRKTERERVESLRASIRPAA